MAKIQLSEGDILLYPGTGPEHDPGRPHRHIVVKVGSTDVFLVPVCSTNSIFDETCVFDERTPILGLSHRSYVAYARGKKVPTASLVRKIEVSEIELKGRLPSDVYVLVKNGVGRSEEVEPWFRIAVVPLPPPRRILQALD